MDGIRLNASYGNSHVGTGTYTRNFIEALPEFEPLDLGVSTQTSRQYWARRQRELALSLSHDLFVHPYWPASIGRRHIVSVLDFVQFDEATRFERVLLGAAARRARAIVVLSRHVQRLVQSRWDLDAIVVPPVPDVDWYARPAQPNVKDRNGHLNIGYWGGWHSRKNAYIAMAALEQAGHDLGFRVTFLVTGRPAKRTSLPITPVRSQTTAAVVALADASDLCIYPSSDEGYGLPVKEALLRGRPILTSRLAVYEEFARNPMRISVDSWRSRGEVRSALATALDMRGFGEGSLTEQRVERRASLSRMRDRVLGATL